MKLREFKIKNLVISLTISAILSTLIVGFLGYFNMRGLNKQVGEMYSEYLISVADIGNIRTNFFQIKSEDFVANHIHTNDFLTKIKPYRDNIDKYLKEYEKTKLDEQETKYINDIKSSYDFFTKLWDSPTTDINAESASQIQTQETKIETSLTALQAYEENIAL